MSSPATPVNGFALLATRRFLPVFLVQFIGAFADNIFRNALLILVTFRLAETQGYSAPVIVAAAAGLFILPFFLFSAMAGQLADKFDKAILTRIMKLIEMFLLLNAALALLAASVPWMLGALFLMGVQSSFFGPVKYSILPQLVRPHELVAANGYVEAGSFIAILLGTIAGGEIVLLEQGPTILAAVMIALGVGGFIAGLLVPSAPATETSLAVTVNPLASTWTLLREAAAHKSVFRALLGISWFWFVGATFLSLFPNYVKDTLQGEPGLVTLFLALFSIGIAVGSVWCSRLLRGEISAQFVPLAALIMAVATLALYGFSVGFAGNGESLSSLEFLAMPAGWAIVLSLLALAVAGGVFTVPLYAIMQAWSEGSHRARIVAANNILNALFMVISAAFTALMFKMGFKITDVFLVTALVSFVFAFYVCALLPRPVAKALFRVILRWAYKVEVQGVEHLQSLRDKGAVLVVNHTSLIDGILLAAFLPGYPTFAVNTHIARQWWAKLFLALVDHYPIDPTNPLAMKSLISIASSNRHVVIFPEGRLTMTGALMKIYEGPGLIADKAHVPVVPVRIDGAQYTPFSYLRGKLRLRWFPRIRISVLPPVAMAGDENLHGRARRTRISDQLYDLMSAMLFETCDLDRTLYAAMLDAAHLEGMSTPVLEDTERKPLSYRRLIAGSQLLGRKFLGFTRRGEIVGLMLPNSVGAALAFFALVAFGRVPAMLNFSSGAANMAAACKAAKISTIITSRRFIEAAKLQPVINELEKQAELIWLEDIRAGVGAFDKLRAFLSVSFAARLHRGYEVEADEPAVVLFTSGSEGTPKGVVLSHKNILANRFQVGARIDFNAADIVFNALPIFHSFGLTGGLLLPVLSGVKTFLYPSPLHYRIISELIYDTNATVIFGTDTFLNGYARMAHAYDFYSVRYIFAGAEKLRDETRRVWADKFGVRILEGYGTTETAPVLAINTPMHNRAGSVGRILPGMAYRLETVPGIERGGRLVVRGPNVMLGYLKAEAPGELQPPEGGWYDTGDIVEFDERSFVTIVGRVKRFAKIAGEMVSLNAVEAYINALWPDRAVAVVAIPDEKKGEQLVLFINRVETERETLLARARELGHSELMVPRHIVVLDQMPVLGTGKTDYVTLNKMARERLGAA